MCMCMHNIESEFYDLFSKNCICSHVAKLHFTCLQHKQAKHSNILTHIRSIFSPPYVAPPPLTNKHNHSTSNQPTMHSDFTHSPRRVHFKHNVMCVCVSGFVVCHTYRMHAAEYYVVCMCVSSICRFVCLSAEHLTLITSMRGCLYILTVEYIDMYNRMFVCL